MTLYCDSAPFPGALTLELLKLGPIRGKAPGWHGNCSTLSLPQSAGDDGKLSPLSGPHFLANPRAGWRALLGVPCVRITCLKLLRGPKTWPPCLLAVSPTQPLPL